LEVEANEEMEEEQNETAEGRMGQMKGKEELREKNEAEAGQNKEQAEKYFHQECYDKLRVFK
jgi:hypothetical protein